MAILSVIGGVWLAALLVIGSNAGTSIIDFYFLICGGLALGIAWAVGFLRTARRTHERASPRRVFFLVPACLAVAVILVVIDGPRNPLFLARFRLSEAALSREAQRLLRTPGAERVPPGTIGLFRVQRGDIVDGQVRFITTSCGVVDSCGFVYSPAAEPKRWQEDVFTPIRGRWWHLMEGF